MLKIVPLLLLIEGVTSKWFCESNELRCIDGTCVPNSKRMDGRKDCPDGKYDEETDHKLWCKTTHGNCAGGKCIHKKKFDDGINDCGDNSDEVRFPCRPPFYSCKSTPVICINMSSLNDGVADCPDASDEVKRLLDSCGLNNQCEGNCTCGRYIPKSICFNDTCVCDTGYRIAASKKLCIPRKLKDSCSTDDDCFVVMNNTVCEEKVCKCGVGFITDGRDTCRTVVIGDECENDQECLLFNNHSRCKEGNCGCASGYYNDNSACLPHHIGDACNITEDCASVIEDSSCDNATCKCKTGHYASDTKDVCLKRKLSDTCEVDVDCQSVINNTLCNKGHCACVENRKPAQNRTVCIQKEIGDECHFKNNCELIENSYCFNNVCTCSIGFLDHDSNKTCIRRRIYDKCDVHDDCIFAVNSSLCQSGICQCEKGMIEVHNLTACRTRVLGDSCSDLFDCSFSFPYSECRNSTCHCLLGYHSVGVNTCQLRKIGDETCQIDQDCNTAVTNSECSNNTCLCISGNIEMLNGSVCAKRNISSPCGLNTDCSDSMNYSLCLNKTCECFSGYKSINDDKACKLRALNDTCKIDADCNDAITNSNCSFGRCFCNSGYKSIRMKDILELYTNLPAINTLFNDNLLSVDNKGNSENEMQCVLRQIGDECIVNTDCSDAVPNSLCKNNTCVCKQGFNARGNSTYICESNRISDVCDVNEDCNLVINESICLNKKCNCVTGYQHSDDKTECNRRKIFDNTCSTSADCYMAVKYSGCIKSQCLCNTGYYASDGNRTCTKFKIGDNNCVTVLDCKEAVSKSSCRQGECKCDNGYMAVNNNTVCKKRIISDPCDADIDCSVAVFRSFCNGTCKCESGYEPNPHLGNTVCVKTPNRLLDTCSFDTQCYHLDNISYCGNRKGFETTKFNFCVCKPGYFERFDQVKQGVCYEPRFIGDYCETRAWCQFGGKPVYCEDDECKCRSGHIPNATYDGCIHLPEMIGDFCRNDSHCSVIPHSECYLVDWNNTCQCHYKYVSSKDGRECLRRPYMFEPEVPSVALGVKCEKRRTCERTEEGRKYWQCSKEIGRSHSRCQCVPGYASKYTSEKFNCQEIQTYYFNINISHELGCEKGGNQDEPLCYQYQPIRVLRQYNNENTKPFLNIRERFVLLGLAALFNDTPAFIRDRYMTSEVLNITASGDQMTIGVLVYFLADYYNIINETELEIEMIYSLIRSNGEIGKSQLKMSWPFDNAIEYKDFDECTEQDGRFSDCASIAWCLNTRVSYMCSCKHGYEDWSVDSDKRPGRICELPQDVTTDSLSCSDGKCENQWEYISLALVGFGFILFFFIGYEIYTRKKKLEKSDIYYKLQKAAKKAKLKALRERRKTMKKKKKDEAKGKNETKEKDQSEEERNLVESGIEGSSDITAEHEVDTMSEQPAELVSEQTVETVPKQKFETVSEL